MSIHKNDKWQHSKNGIPAKKLRVNMPDICIEYYEKHELMFNVKKSVCMIFQMYCEQEMQFN